MTYDNEGRLTSWTAPSGTSASETSLYDNEGKQVLTTSSQSGTPTDTVYFDDYTETTITSGTSSTTTYYSINGQRLAVRVNGSTIDYLVNDLLGNVSLALNDVGTIIAVQLYEPYGQMNYAWGSMPTAHNYTGQRLDSQSGLLYYQFRWYDPFSGQFTRTDTKQTNAQGFNPYAYVSDNPETKNDPTGHWGWGAILAVVAVVVVVAVVAVVAAPVVIAAAGAAAEVAADGAVAGAVAEGAVDAAAAGGEAAAAAGGEAAAAAGGEAAATAGGEAAATGGEAAADASADAAADATADTSADASADTSADASSDTGDEGCSFTPQTRVATAQGQQPISQLKVGQKVWAWNQSLHMVELEPIQHVWIDKDSDLVDLTVAQVKQQNGKTIVEKQEVLHTNQKHPFLTKEKGFLPVGQIKVGMHLLESNGQVGIVVGWKSVAGTRTMYNLEVTQDHTFTVGEGHWIVHNRCGDSSNVNLNNKSKLNHLFSRHGDDWGLSGQKWNNTTMGKLQNALTQHLEDPYTGGIPGTYRGQPAIHYYNPLTDLNLSVDPTTNEIWGGWRLVENQIWNILGLGGNLI